jgi:peptidoglycan/LPS O-acetylase OafA/YrhL
MVIRIHTKLEWLVMLLLVIALLTLFWFYYINRIGAGQLLFAEISLSLALVALLPPSSNSAKPFSIRLPVSLWIFPVAVYIVAETELHHLRHTGLGYVMALAFTFLITALAEEKPAKKAAVATAIVVASSIPLYTLYAPSFGNVSLMSGLDPVWASVVTGLLYLLQLPLVVFLLSRRFGGFDDFRGAFVLLMVLLAVIWSAWYIPQVYSLTLFLTAFLAGSALLRIPLLAAGVFWPWGCRHLDGADYYGSLDL